MTFNFAQFAEQIRTQDTITPRGTLALRQWAWTDGAIGQHEAEALFALNDLGKSDAPEWVDCFVEAICVYVVEQAQPKGYVSDSIAEWLIARINHDGRVESRGELELIIRIAEKATNIPEALKQLALAELEKTILTGSGATRCGQTLNPGRVDAIEAHLLRRLIFAQAGAGALIVGASEAQALFRIKNATLGPDGLGSHNAPEWKSVFVQGVANYLAGYSCYEPLSADVAARLEKGMNAHDHSSLGKLVDGARGFSLKSVIDLLLDRSDVHTPDRDAGSAEAAKITSSEQFWLDQNVGTTIDPYEQALLDFLKNDTP